MKRVSFLLAILLFGFTAIAQEISADVSKSEIKWTGKKVSGEHWGYIDLKSGSFVIEDGKITSGTFTIDMTTIVCEDLESPEWNQKLVGHLKSDDFFSVDKFKTATLKIKESSEFKNGVAEVKGDLTIKGITNPISFKAKKESGNYLATITVDRTKYDVKYGSGKFFDNLGDNMIDDDFTLDVKLVTK
ncbi:MAG: YceI family protein [Bacteroidetes bacterium]|nr:YceI family protein [Bacteroidota bacterium]